jgi:hypothetical protein
MKGYWDLEFEPSVEEIMDLSMRYGNSLSSLSLASSVLILGGFLVQSSLFEAQRVKIFRVPSAGILVRMHRALSTF